MVRQADPANMSAAEAEAILGAALDGVRARMVNDGYMGFEGISTFKASRFGRMQQWQRRWKQSQPCLFPGCSLPSIRRSHALSRSGPLARIAEDGHVLTPHFDTRTSQRFLKRIGLQHASTFPGFCDEHEGTFNRFEQAGILKGAEHLELQFFRTACREYRVMQELSRTLAQVLADNEEEISRRAAAIMNEELARFGVCLRRTIQRVFLSELDAELVQLRQRLRRLQRELEFLKSVFLEPLCARIEGAGGDSPVTMISVEGDALIPVALAGQGRFQGPHSESGDTVNALLVVWPQGERTQIAMMGEAHHEADLRRYITAFTEPEQRLVAMVETWMIQGTDHWYLRPSVWDAIPDDRKARILDDFADDARNIGSEYDRSVFDELRNEFINSFPAEVSEGWSEYRAEQQARLTR